MKTLLKFILFLFLMIFSLTIFLIPLIVSITTGNWWYMFLFSVSWIPALFIAYLSLFLFNQYTS